MRITSKGQVTIPKAVRDRLGVKPGDDIGFREEGQTVVVFSDEKTTHKNPPTGFAQRIADYCENLRREGRLEPLGMTVDEYIDEIRGYSQDANDPGFQRRT